MSTKEELERQVADLQEKLYEAGIEERPTMMKAIKDKEQSILSLITWQIEELEKETGKQFPYILNKREKNEKTLPNFNECHTSLNFRIQENCSQREAVKELYNYCFKHRWSSTTDMKRWICKYISEL